jgi:hypothetical protein
VSSTRLSRPRVGQTVVAVKLVYKSLAGLKSAWRNFRLGSACKRHLQGSCVPSSVRTGRCEHRSRMRWRNSPPEALPQLLSRWIGIVEEDPTKKAGRGSGIGQNLHQGCSIVAGRLGAVALQRHHQVLAAVDRGWPPGMSPRGCAWSLRRLIAPPGLPAGVSRLAPAGHTRGPGHVSEARTLPLHGATAPRT